MDDRHPNHRSPNDSPEGEAAFGGAHLHGEELLSAYLDGECSPAEVAEIEARLEASSELRQLAEEMRGVRATLGLLRQHRLERGFADQVLRRAEREVLAGRTEPPPGLPSDTDLAAPPEPLRRATPSGGASSARPFLWSLAALAAAILILVIQQGPEIRRDPVARGPEARVPHADSTDRESTGAIEKSELKSRAKVKSLSSNDDKMESAPAPSEPVADGNRDHVSDRALGLSFGAQMKKDESESAAAKEAEGTVAEKPALAKDSREEAADRKSLQTESLTAGAEAKKQSPAGEPDADKLTTRARSLLDSVTNGARSDAVPLQTAPGAVPPGGPNAPAPEGRLPALNEAAPRSPAAPAPGNSLALEQNSELSDLGQSAAGRRGAVQARNGQAAPPVDGESLRVVEVLVARDAWQRGAVDDVLAKNRIVVVNEESDPAQSSSTRTEPRGGEAAKESGRFMPSELNTRGRSSEKRSAAVHDGLELVVVTATASQVNGAIADFQQQNQFQVLKSTDVSPPDRRSRQSGGERSERDQSGDGGTFGNAKDLDTIGPVLGRSADEAKESEQPVPPSVQPGLPRRSPDFADRASSPADSTLSPADSPTVKKKAADLLQDRDSPKSGDDFSRQAPTARRSLAPKASTDDRKKAGTTNDPAARLSATPSEGFKTETTAGAAVPSAGIPARGLEMRGGGGGVSGGGRPAGGANQVSGGGFGGGYGSASRGGYGGIANGPVRDAQFGGAGSAREAFDIPAGYGQRITLERGSAMELGQGLAAGLSAQEEAGARLNKAIGDQNAQSGGLEQQRVLFFFRIADAPVPTTTPLGGIKAELGQSGARAKSNEPAAESGAPPVPAPANAAGSQK